MADTDTASPERKEKVIHTRVPPVLDEELKHQAARLGISVSNLIRNVLNNTFNLVDDVIHDSATIAARSGKQPVQSRSGTSPATGAAAVEPPAAPAIVGWQKLTLNLNAVCSQCNEIMPRGGEGALAITLTPAASTFLCLSCLDKVKP